MSLFRAFGLFILQIPLTLAGLVIVAATIPFRKTDESTRKPFSQHPEHGSWVFSNFPGWWGNPFDGLNEDKRGWFANWCIERGIKYPSWLAMWIWAAIRNPINYWSRCVVGVDVSLCTIDKLAGQDVVEADKGNPGWQFLCATRNDGKKFHRFFAELPYPFRKNRMFTINLGWKIKLAHNSVGVDDRPQDRLKGDVFRLSFWKVL